MAGAGVVERAGFSSQGAGPVHGWSEEQRRKRLALLANNSRLLVLPDSTIPT